MRMKKVLPLFGVVLLALMLVPAPSHSAKPITLKIVGFIPAFVPNIAPAGWFAKRVTERSNGELIVKFLGGPEIISEPEQGEAVRTGVIDIAVLPPPYYWPLVPAAYATMLSDYKPWEERKVGAYELLVKHHEKSNLRYLGDLGYSAPFYLFTTKQYKTPHELAKELIITNAITRFVEALGAVPVSVPGEPETFTAMERGLANGFEGVPTTVAAFGLGEVAKYVIDHGVYHGRMNTIMNLDKWNRLPKHLQELIVKVMVEIEPEAADYIDELTAKDWQTILDAGTKKYKFSPADAKWYVDLAYESYWTLVKDNVSPSEYEELRKTFRK